MILVIREVTESGCYFGPLAEHPEGLAEADPSTKAAWHQIFSKLLIKYNPG